MISLKDILRRNSNGGMTLMQFNNDMIVVELHEKLNQLMYWTFSNALASSHHCFLHPVPPDQIDISAIY